MDILCVRKKAIGKDEKITLNSTARGKGGNWSRRRKDMRCEDEGTGGHFISFVKRQQGSAF